MKKIIPVLGLSTITSLASIFSVAHIARADCHEDTTPEPVEYSTAIRINELLPNPSGEESADEFIELYNDSNESVDLTGWILSDASTKEYTLSGTIGGGQYKTIYRSNSGIALNNTGGDVAELYQPDGELLDSIEYEDSAAEDTSYAIDTKGVWYWTTTLTPGRENVITEVESSEESEDSEDSQETIEDDTDDNEETELDPSYEYSDDIELSELLPDPEGSDATDEWIELVNTGNSAVNLFGWQIADASKTYVIEDSLELGAGEYYYFSIVETKVSLNNSGETITLYDPANDVMDEVEYPAAETGESYARISGTWQWTSQLTPGEANQFGASTTTSAAASISPDVAARSINESDTTQAVYSITAAKQLQKGEDVIVQGTVNALPEIYSTQYFYIQDETSGIQIYSSQKTFPELAVGDVVTVHGKTSEANGEFKINISAQEDISIDETGQTITPLEVTEYIEADLGKLVMVTGEVTEKSGSTIVLDSGWNVYFKRGSGLKTSSLTEGQHIQAVGVLTASNDGIRVLPRGTDDIQPLTSEDTRSDSLIKSAHASSGKSPNENSTTSNQQYTLDGLKETATTTHPLVWLAILGGVLAVSIGLSRSEKLKTLLRNYIAQRAHGLANRLGHSVAAEKNTTDLNGQNQYRG